MLGKINGGYTDSLITLAMKGNLASLERWVYGLKRPLLRMKPNQMLYGIFLEPGSI